MNKGKTFWIVIAVVVVGLSGLVYLNNKNQAASSALAGTEVTVYRSATCGCCKNYIAYLKRQGFTVNEEVVSDIKTVKAEYAIPSDLSSCHTTVMGDYVVEGHVPVEVIQQLKEEKPDVAGIALPGMPQGSPGMAGAKVGSWSISSFTKSGDVSLFTSY